MYIIVSKVTHHGLCVPAGTLVEWLMLLEFDPDLGGPHRKCATRRLDCRQGTLV